MIRHVVMLWILATIALGCAITLSCAAALRAYRSLGIASIRLSETIRDAGTITEIRARLPAYSLRDEARGSLTPRVTTAMERAGLPAATLVSLSPQAESGLAREGGVQLSSRRATLMLSNLSLPQLGRFLDAWRSTEVAWLPVSIDLSPASGKPPDAGGDLPLRVVITIESRSLKEAGS